MPVDDEIVLKWIAGCVLWQCTSVQCSGHGAVEPTLPLTLANCWQVMAMCPADQQLTMITVYDDSDDNDE